MNQSRREFLQASTTLGAASLSLRGQGVRRILIESDPQPVFLRRLAERELLRGLERLRLPWGVGFTGRDSRPQQSDLLMVLRVDPTAFRTREAYEISCESGRLLFRAEGEQALLYSVFDFLERQGAFFGTDGESYPLEPAPDLSLPS